MERRFFPAAAGLRRGRAMLVSLILLTAAGCEPGPTGVAFLPFDFADVQAGGAHSCGLSVAGAVICWGRGFEGQLGQAAFGSAVYPVTVHGDRTYTALAAGNYHSCALDSAGQAWCWGWGHFGQRGTGTQESLSTAEGVQQAGIFTEITAGHHHTCALDTDGAAWCWGDNAQGQLGTGGPGMQPVPARVAGDAVFSTISAGGYHTCAVDSGGVAYCWGLNHLGQLGTGNAESQLVPAPVVGPTNFASVSGGAEHTCGLTTAGLAFCWGSTRFGELGGGHAPVPGQPDVPTWAPAPVLQSTGAYRAISAGRNFTCAIDTLGDAFCWGNGYDGQLGGGRMGAASTPQKVALPANTRFTTISAGLLTHVCATTESRAAFCWGTGTEGGLGPGATVIAQPTRVPGPL